MGSPSCYSLFQSPTDVCLSFFLRRPHQNVNQPTHHSFPPFSRFRARHLFSKAWQWHSQTFTQPCMWFMEEQCQFSLGQTAQSLTCSIMEKPHTGSDDCLRMLQTRFRKRMSDSEPDVFQMCPTYVRPRLSYSHARK